MSIIVSQNSTDLVAGRVIADLAARGPVDAPAIARMRASELVAALRPAGLARRKVPRIQAIARLLVDRHGGTMDVFLAAPAARARGMLLALPGVGPKSADVWLNLVAGRDAMPMDTHIARLVRRWRLSSAGDYERVNETLRRYVPPSQRQRGHLALIRFGREICQARRPRCEACPVWESCDWERKLPRKAGGHAHDPGRSKRR